MESQSTLHVWLLSLDIVVKQLILLLQPTEFVHFHHCNTSLYFAHHSINERLDGFQFLTIMNGATMSILVYVSEGANVHTFC